MRASFMEYAAMTRRKAIKLMLAGTGMVVSGIGFARAGQRMGAAAADADWASLQDAVAGRVVARGDAAYEAIRNMMVWNGRKPSRYPDAIVQVASDKDVQAAVQFARRNRLRVAVRGSGHSMVGSPLREGGILIDLAQLNRVTVDPAARIVHTEPVVRGREFAAILASHDFAFPTGHNPDVSIGGYLLGGGFGWNAGQWGPACFNIVGADVVTADGRLVRASAAENPDLFWAIRGAGCGFFGVVTKYDLQLYSLPKTLRSSTLVFPLDCAPEIAAWAAGIAPTLPRNVEMTVCFTHAPAQFAGECRQVCVVPAVAFANTPEEAEAALAPIAACPVPGALSRALNVPSSFNSLFDGDEKMYPRGHRFASDLLWLSADPVATLTTLMECFSRVPSAKSTMVAGLLPPPPSAPPVPDAALSMFAPVFAGCYAIWDNPAGDRENDRWLRETREAVAPSTVGYYISEANLSATRDHSRRSFSPESWARLQTLKRRYDPEDVFYSYLGPDPAGPEV